MRLVDNARDRTVERTAACARIDDLLISSAGGDPTAFATLHAETAPRATALATRVLCNRDLAQDAVQDSYLTIWRTASRFDPDKGNGLGWIFLIVHRTAIDHVRTSEARSRRDTRHVQQHAALSDRCADPTQDLALATLEACVVRSALADLTPLQRQALELAYLDSHTYAEVADLLAIPTSTAKSRIYSAMRRLRTTESLRAVADVAAPKQSADGLGGDAA